MAIPKRATFFSWHNLLYRLPHRLTRYEAVRIGQSTAYTGVWFCGRLMGIYEE